MKQEFIEYLNKLIEATPQIEMTDNVRAYIELLTAENVNDKPIITDNGKLVLKYMQEHLDTITWKARDIGEGLFISSRGVSGSLRKLVSDGFVVKVGADPVIYSLTEKGKNFVID